MPSRSRTGLEYGDWPGTFSVETRRSGGSWTRLPDAVVPCGYCGGSGLDPGERHVPEPGSPCTACRALGRVVEPLWSGPSFHEPPCVREELVEPLRGLPHDAAQETVDAVAQALDDLRRLRPTWLTLAEVVEYDWDSEVERDGWLNLSDYAVRRRGGFAGAIAFSHEELQADGQDYAYLERDEADAMLAADPSLAKSDFAAEEAFVHVQWRERARLSQEGSVAAFLEFVADLEPHRDRRDVRIVFLV